MIILIILFILIVFVIPIWSMLHSFHTYSVVNCFTGGLGSGKTYLCTQCAISDYRKILILYKLHKNTFIGKSKLFRWLDRMLPKYPPQIFSTYPILLSKKYNIYSRVLKKDHLLLKEKFENCVPIVVIDELGSIANQYAYDDLNVISFNTNEYIYTLETFIRYFRHIYGEGNNDMCRIYINDQNTSDITVNIRRRINKVYVLEDFHRAFGILPKYKVSYYELTNAEDTMTNINSLQQFDDKGRPLEKPYFVGWLPYRWQKIKLYDSHCYSEIVNSHIEYENVDSWAYLPSSDKLKATRPLDIRSNIKLKDWKKSQTKTSN